MATRLRLRSGPWLFQRLVGALMVGGLIALLLVVAVML